MLKDFILANKIGAVLFASEEEIRGAGRLARMCGLELEDSVKTFLFVSEKSGGAVLAVFLAGTKVDVSRLEKASGFSGLFPATENESIELTGFDSESIPPVSVYGIKTFVDKKVFEKKLVAASGGDKFHALKISPQEIQEFGFEVQEADII